MNRAELEAEVKRLRDQLVGVKLLAEEMADEVETARQNVHVCEQGRPRDRVVESLARLDSLLEPLRNWRRS